MTEIAKNGQREQFETAVDVIMDDRHCKGKLVWELELEGRRWGVKSVAVYPRRLEIEDGELPEFLRDRDFGEVFGDTGMIWWRRPSDPYTPTIAFAPDLVVINTRTQAIRIYMDIR